METQLSATKKATLSLIKCLEVLKGSRKNKFTVLGVEAPVWQGAKPKEYRDIMSFRNAVRRDASANKM
jgi:hypothetical protein